MIQVSSVSHYASCIFATINNFSGTGTVWLIPLIKRDAHLLSVVHTGWTRLLLTRPDAECFWHRRAQEENIWSDPDCEGKVKKAQDAPWKRTQPADKTWILCLCPVYRIMLSISGGDAPCLSNLIWAVTRNEMYQNARRDGICCLLSHDSDRNCTKKAMLWLYLHCSLQCKGRERDWPGVSPLTTKLQTLKLLVSIDRVSDWEQEQAAGSLCKKSFSTREGRGIRAAFRELIQTKSLHTVYIFTSSSLLSSQ